MPIEFSQLEESIKNLPQLPASVTEAMEILNREEVHFPLLEEKIGSEPALAARILTVANPPFYGFGGKINSIKQACMVLGFHTTRNIVMAAGVMSEFDTAHFQRLDLKALWQHSLGCGIAAKVLAKKTGLDPEQAFSAGLLHDIGKMVLNIFYSEDYTKVLDYRDEHDCPLIEAEEQVLGFNHAIVGSLMAKRWTLPDDIISAIEHHHQPESEQATPLARLLHVADVISRSLKIGNSGDTHIPLLNPDTLLQLGLEEQDIEQATPEIETSITESAAFID